MNESSESNKIGKVRTEEQSNSIPNTGEKSHKDGAIKENINSCNELEDDRSFLTALQQYPDLRGKVMSFLKRKLQKQADEFQQEVNTQKTKLIEDFTKQISKLQKREKESQKLLQEYQAKQEKRAVSSQNSTRPTTPNSIATGSSNGDGYISQGNSEKSVSTEYSNPSPRVSCAHCMHWKQKYDQLQHDHSQLQHQLAILSLVHSEPAPSSMSVSHSPKYSDAYKQLQEQYCKQEQQLFTVQQRQLYHLEQITAQQTQIHALDIQHQKLLSQYSQLEKQYQHSQKKLALFTPSSSSSTSFNINTAGVYSTTQFPKLVSPDTIASDSPSSFSASPAKASQPQGKKLFQAFADSDSDEEGSSSGAGFLEKPKAMATYYQGYTQISTILEEESSNSSTKNSKTVSSSSKQHSIGTVDEEMVYISSPTKERFPAYVQVKRDNKDLRHRILINEQLVSSSGTAGNVQGMVIGPGGGVNVISISGNSLGGNSLSPLVVAPSPTHYPLYHPTGTTVGGNSGGEIGEKPVMMSMHARSKSLQFIPTTTTGTATTANNAGIGIGYPTTTTISFRGTTITGVGGGNTTGPSSGGGNNNNNPIASSGGKYIVPKASTTINTGGMNNNPTSRRK